MAETIRIAFRKLGGEADAPPLTPPWFLPGAETVWQSIAQVERALRAIVGDVYRNRFGEGAWQAVEATLGDREREGLARASRSRPATSDPMTLLDYLYLAQLPALLFKQEVWPAAQAKLGGGGEAKRRLRKLPRQADSSQGD